MNIFDCDYNNSNNFPCIIIFTYANADDDDGGTQEKFLERWCCRGYGPMLFAAATTDTQ